MKDNPKNEKAGCFSSEMITRRLPLEKPENSDCYGNAKGKLDKVFNSFSHM